MLGILKGVARVKVGIYMVLNNILPVHKVHFVHIFW